MRIGLTFNVRRAERPSDVSRAGFLPLPGDDQEEEFDSPETIAAIAEVLSSLGHEVELLGNCETLLERLLNGPRPDLVWNIAEGQGGGRCREAQVPAVLEMLGIPYTGSDPLTLSATLDKDCAKRLVSSVNVPTPRWFLYDGAAESVSVEASALAFPVFVKPAYEGSSKGILNRSVLHDVDELQAALEQLHEVYRQPVLVEEFIDGDELTVGVVGNEAPEVLGIMRILPRLKSSQPFVYGLEVKRDWQRLASYECPARLAPKDIEAVNRAALSAWRVLGCRDVARFDFRLRDGVPYFLETNPLPGLSPTSGDLVLLAREIGVEHAALVAKILQATCDRLAHTDARPHATKVLAR